MLIGDFNFLLEDIEWSLKGGASTCFQNWVMRSGLIDLGDTGSPFTWRHGISIETRKAARLNRALGYDKWRCLFSSATL